MFFCQDAPQPEYDFKLDTNDALSLSMVKTVAKSTIIKKSL